MSTWNQKSRPGRNTVIPCILVLAALVTFSCGGKEPQPKGSEGGDPAAGASAGSPAGQDRRPAPDFTLKDLDGRDVRLADFRGKVVMVNFWATWCPPCRMEIPDFVALQRELGSQGFQIIGISLDDEGAAKVRPFAEQNGINYTMLVNGNQAANSYGQIEGIPTTFLLDRQGRVVERQVGVASRQHWQQMIALLLKEG